ncbi:aminotransferase class I/II-fold pyridoxal phosphate-dependent enzyme [Natrarchaeobius chitinivorans]|uniref:Aminotransferase class I/II-fold pyridoxal phosphate-dependent enzyme n=1 Tax=Natrarchaeobius chitinivorans TaxID=1679083 RepID=A0A3N6LV08_NATCH|nr:aminotransferase class I/II-fold pyridoxal phosphate-dependent enzyme [Natrarchaeobius chitinivorans]RQG94163.1 aminotransferase class I/II-fold pyridoxal phosphate-dependent enzyme [Natrarchaeobius chitinivorans]
MTQNTDYLREKYREMDDRGETWPLNQLETATQARPTVEGREVIMLASNNYLDLANDPRLQEAAIDAIERFGVGAGSDWSIAGYTILQDELHETIASFKGTEAGLSYQTGFAVNAGLLPQLLEAGDVYVSDELNHGSIIDGIRLSPADSLVYDHSDMADLEDTLRTAREEYERIIVVTDGVFSMDGDVAKLDEIQTLAEEYDAMTYVDDCHGEGVLGEGHGITAEFGLEDDVDFQMGSFSKACGGFGGMLAGDQHVIDFAYNTSRTWLLSAGYPPAIAAANKRALEIVDDEPSRVRELWEKRDYFASELESIGFDTGNSETPIVPAMVGESTAAQKLAERLFEEGVFALAIVYPMVARGKARIRNQINVGLTDEDLNEALRVYEDVGRELDLV